MDPNNHFISDNLLTPQDSQTQANVPNAMNVPNHQRIPCNQEKQLADQQQQRTDKQFNLNHAGSVYRDGRAHEWYSSPAYTLQTNPPYTAGVQNVNQHAHNMTFQKSPAEYSHNSNANFKTISNGLKLLCMEVSTKTALHPSITDSFCLFLLKKHNISESRLLPLIIDAVQVMNTSCKACVLCAMRHPPTFAETGGKILTLISNQSYFYPLVFINCIKTLQQYADIITGDNIRQVRLLSFSDRIQISKAASENFIADRSLLLEWVKREETQHVSNIKHKEIQEENYRFQPSASHIGKTELRNKTPSNPGTSAHNSASPNHKLASDSLPIAPQFHGCIEKKKDKGKSRLEPSQPNPLISEVNVHNDQTLSNLMTPVPNISIHPDTTGNFEPIAGSIASKSSIHAKYPNLSPLGIQKYVSGSSLSIGQISHVNNFALNNCARQGLSGTMILQSPGVPTTLLFPSLVKQFVKENLIVKEKQCSLTFNFPSEFKSLLLRNKAYCLRLTCYKTSDVRKKCNWDPVKSVIFNKKILPICKTYTQTVNGCIRVIGINLHQSLTAYVELGVNEMNFQFEGSSSYRYCAIVELVKYCDIEESINIVTNFPQWSIEEVINFCIHLFNLDDSFCDKSNGKVEITLECPITLQRIKIPVRSKNCMNHIRSFDLHNWLLSYRFVVDSNSHNCPICGVYILLTDLILDVYLTNVLKDLPKHVQVIDYHQAGAFEVDINKDINRQIDLEEEEIS